MALPKLGSVKEVNVIVCTRPRLQYRPDRHVESHKTGLRIVLGRSFASEIVQGKYTSKTEESIKRPNRHTGPEEHVKFGVLLFEVTVFQKVK